MIEINFFDNGRIVKGILLGKYHYPHDEEYSYEKKFLWKTKKIYAIKKSNSPLYAIFIPWKHQMKEIREVDEKYIINLESLNTLETWIKKEKFISETYMTSLKITDFLGYKFMYDNNSFIANLCSHEFQDCLTILYENIPDILTIDLNNIEY